MRRWTPGKGKVNVHKESRLYRVTLRESEFNIDQWSEVVEAHSPNEARNKIRDSHDMVKVAIVGTSILSRKP